MSRTNRGEKGGGHEYWSRRYPWYLNPGKKSKRLTKRLERRQAKKEIRDEQEDQE